MRKRQDPQGCLRQLGNPGAIDAHSHTCPVIHSFILWLHLQKPDGAGERVACCWLGKKELDDAVGAHAGGAAHPGLPYGIASSLGL